MHVLSPHICVNTRTLSQEFLRRPPARDQNGPTFNGPRYPGDSSMLHSAVMINWRYQDLPSNNRIAPGKRRSRHPSWRFVVFTEEWPEMCASTAGSPWE